MGDGRHRQDPGGHSRYLIAGIGILVVLALLAIGAYALYSVLTAQPESTEKSGPTTQASSRADDPTQRASVVRDPASSVAPAAESPPSARPSAPPTLRLTVTGTHSYVAVSTPGGQTLLSDTLRQGYTATFRQSELTVTIGDPSAVKVTVGGQTRNTETKGIDSFTVSRSELAGAPESPRG